MGFLGGGCSELEVLEGDRCGCDNWNWMLKYYEDECLNGVFDLRICLIWVELLFGWC